MRLPNTAHTDWPWRIHEITRDFRVEDVWALPTPGGPGELARLVRAIALSDPSQGSSAATRGARPALAQSEVWDIIRALAGAGTTILLCTQYLDEADQLAEGIAVIDHGRVIAEGTPAQLKASVGSGALHIRLLDPEQRAEAERVMGAQLGAIQLESDPAALSAPCADSGRASEVLAALARAGLGVADFSLAQPSLDEVFLALTGRRAEQAASDEQSNPEQEVPA